ncbi:hypothetical protein VPAG_00072 [Vibrio phage douglas 12A4]|uniref:hypothetical protein n=1 Tax=Vibrio phage douglas 12A4 TaxID=573171 RepID=UPI0002C0EB4D|nr:hypothetical protein VPAG_00072 [Vibrio phage douglas 12A4]AGG58108.1 hypothetical protein VPAG_00072 [Vibrio phage douglas 12A4]
MECLTMTQRTGITEITAPVAAGSPDTPLAVHYNNEQQGGLKRFATIAERDGFTSKFRSRLLGSVAYVTSGENGYVSIYSWTGTKIDGSDGTWKFEGYMGGIVLADTDGAIPNQVATMVLSSDFSIQAAGDQGDGSLISLSDAIKQKLDSKSSSSDGMITAGTYLKPSTFSKGTTLEFEPPFNVFPDPDKKESFRVTMNHGVFEGKHAEGYLAYFDYGEVIIGSNAETTKHSGVVWADKVAYGSNNVYLYEDRNDKSVILQETDMLDPNVTGGTPILCAVHFSFYGKAFGDGSITAVLINKMTGLPLTQSGQPIGVTKHYKQGQEFDDISVAEIYMAKGSTKAAWKVTHTFNEDPVKFEDWLEGDSCVLFQAMNGKEEASVALNQFQIATGTKIEFERKYYGVDFFSLKWALSIDIAEQTSGSNSGQVSNLGIAMINPDPMKDSIGGGVLHIKDDGTHMGYFMVGDILSEEDTKNIRGKTFIAKAVVSNTQDATKIYMVVYKGDVSKADLYFLKGTKNMQPVLASGWSIAHSVYEPEEAGVGYDTVGGDFTIPADADLVAFMVGPQDEQSPMDISIKDFNVSAKVPFTVYDTKGVKMNGGVALKFNNTVAQFHTLNKRWTINSAKTNLPFGERKDGSAPISLFVEQDNVSGYIGGVKYDEDGKAGIRIYVNMYLGESAKSTGSTTNFWVEDVDGNKIPDSDAPETILKANDSGAHSFNWEFNYNGEAGTKLKLFAKSSVDDGAYVETASYDAVGTLVNFVTI